MLLATQPHVSLEREGPWNHAPLQENWHPYPARPWGHLKKLPFYRAEFRAVTHRSPMRVETHISSEAKTSWVWGLL